MIKLPDEKIFSRRWFISYGFIIFGSALMSAGFVFFISPYKLAPGGVYGISIMLHHLYEMYHSAIQSLFSFVIPDNLDISVMALCMDVPLCLLGMRILGPMFGVKTVVSFLTLALFTYIFENTWGYKPFVDDIMLSSIFGAVFIGFGSGLVFKSNATSGGTDVISMILSRRLHIPLGNMVIMVDSCVVLFTLIAFKDVKIPMYSFLVIYIVGRIVNSTMSGFTQIKTIFIISDKYEEIAQFIISLDRGGTLLYGEGMYSGESKKVIYSNVNLKEVNLIRQFILEVDPNAFITILDANRVVGDGRNFKKIHEMN